MSTRTVHSRTSRSAVRGRGRGGPGSHKKKPSGSGSRPVGAGSQYQRGLGNSSSDEEEELGRSVKGTDEEGRPKAEERTLQSRGTHYVLSPDSSKNSKLKSTARHEEQQYKRHKEEKMERVADMLSQQEPVAVGGPRYTKSDLREMRIRQEKEQQAEAKFAAVRSRQKREEYHRKERQIEEEELQKMKQAQREKAIRLEEKKKTQQQVDLEELRRKRLARFDTM